MEALLHAVRSLFLFPAQRQKSSAPHPAEPELPWARAKLRALRSAAQNGSTNHRDSESLKALD
jgi:hypothetical protein